MITERLTSKDYRKELNALKQAEKSLDVHVTNRLFELGKLFPDAVVTTIEGVDIKGGGIFNNIKWIQDLLIETRLKYMETIENWNAEHQKTKQTKLDFLE